jgi:hypothetical protein
MTVQVSRRGMAAMQTAPVAVSSFVRRLVRAHDDPVKQRVRAWLMEIDDTRLRTFGLAPEDITILRAALHWPQRMHCIDHGQNKPAAQRARARTT